MPYDIHSENLVFRELFERNPHPMWVFDLETLAFLAVNDSACEKYGYSRDEFLSMKTTAIRPENEVSRFIEHLRHQDDNVDRAGLWRHCRKDGSLLYADITAQKIVFSGRSAEIVFAIDMTGQVAAQKNLEDAEQRYRGLVEQSLVGIYVLRNTRIAYANPHMAQMFGYSMEELEDLDFLQLAAEADRENLRDLINRRLEGEEGTGHRTVHCRRKDGSGIIVDIHATMLAGQEQPALTGVLVDVTEAKKAEERSQQHVAQLERMIQHTIGAITTMGDIRDAYTAGHERRVGDLAAAIGRELGADADTQRWLQVTGMVHDTGKVGVPTDILTKPKALTVHEFGVVKAHPELGFEILKSVEFPRPVARATLQHHERLDGSGYPHGLKGGDILMEARIVAVADVTESMVSHRPYRPSLALQIALDELREKSGTKYDPDAVDACVRLFRDGGYGIEWLSRDGRRS